MNNYCETETIKYIIDVIQYFFLIFMILFFILKFVTNFD